jgi:uncharacterized protein YdhG (YjbR/CyaY superfamily)
VSPAASVEEYLAAVPEHARPALEKVRQAVRAVLPEATEAISYGIPTFKEGGTSVVGYGASKNHCSLYVMSPAVMEAHRDDLEGYETSKGTIRFPADRPLPAALVKKLVKARIKENEGS